MSNGRLHDKVVVVTGSASGIGAAALATFRREGAIGIGVDLRPSLIRRPFL